MIVNALILQTQCSIKFIVDSKKDFTDKVDEVNPFNDYIGVVHVTDNIELLPFRYSFRSVIGSGEGLDSK